MSEWFEFNDARFPFRFRYPAVMPSGNSVRFDKTDNEMVIKEHLRSNNSHELYFEVTCYHTVRDVQEAYEQFTAGLRKQFEVVEIEPLQETTISGQAAEAFSFRWPEAGRRAIFVSQPDGLYRILYDPELPLNLEILQSVVFD